MARPRIHDLPKNLYFSKMAYRYKMADGKEVYLGRDKDAALRFALHANLHRNNGYTKRPASVRQKIKQLFSEEEILSLGRPYSPSVGIYFLIHEDRIVYVGQSVNCEGRIHGHTTGAEQKLFDSYHIVGCPVHKLDELEALYIQKFRPPLNLVESGKRYIC